MGIKSLPVSAQSTTEKTISIGKIREQVKNEISQMKDAAKQGQQSEVEAMEMMAEQRGTTLEELFTEYLIKDYKEKGYEITDEESSTEKSEVVSSSFSMPTDMNAHFKSKGLKLQRMTRNSYWCYPIWANTTAIDISNALEVPIDSLLPLSVTFVRDYYQAKNGFRSREWDEEAKLTKYLTPPYPTYKEVSGFDGSRLYFSNNPTLQVAPSRPYNENISFADNLQKYSGDFNYHWDANVHHNVPGKATYTYRAASDGSRIFEGKFSYLRNQSSGEYVFVHYGKITGQFKNNVQVGHWEWEFDSDKKPIMSIDFDKEGRLNGEVIYNGCHALFKDGVLKYVEWNRHGIETCGYFTLSGAPKNEWTVKRKGRPTITVKFNEIGGHVSSGYRDNSTGDWQEVYQYKDVESIPYEISDMVGDYLMRDTPLYKPDSSY